MNRRDFLLAASAAAGGSAAASGTAAAQQANGSGGGGGNATGGGGGNATGGGGNQSSGGGNQSAAGGGGGGGGPTKTVTVGPGGALTFEPETLTIPTGGKVKFVWDSGGHNVNPKSGDWGHQPIEDKGFSYTTPPFQKTGSQKYWCDPHKSAGMVGTIQVGSSGGGGGGGEEEPSPEEMGVPFQAHFVGIATLLMMVLSLVYTFFLVKYGESPNAKGGD
ncbi:plastocyanin/azurin family copper-binding protein [Halococcus sp. AFM35]|uniref:plastocyanin/azurin family copper-binding protein n=1 Tax=Halococcus sp. AFM35 TaxID=3421653 RepID=UPI003EB6FFD7